MFFSPRNSNLTDRSNASGRNRQGNAVEDVPPQDEFSGEEEEVTFHEDVEDQENDVGLSYDQQGQDWDQDHQVQKEWEGTQRQEGWQEQQEQEGWDIPSTFIQENEDTLNQQQQQLHQQPVQEQQMEMQEPGPQQLMEENIINRLSEHINQQMAGYFHQFDSLVDRQNEIKHNREVLAQETT